MDEDNYEGVECDQCGEICWEHTSYFGDIRCDECAYEDETYRREILGDGLYNNGGAAARVS